MNDQRILSWQQIRFREEMVKKVKSKAKSKKVTGKKKTSSRRAVGSSTGKKTSKKVGSKGRPAKRSLWRRLFRLSMLLAGLIIGLGTPWVIYLDIQIQKEFDGRKWDLPSRVFARPLSLYDGAAMSRQSLLTELDAAGYRQSAGPSSSGRYWVSGNRFDIYRRAFTFDDGAEAAVRFQFELVNDTVASLGGNAEIATNGLVRLDPAEIASIYPLDDEDRKLIALQDVPVLLVTGLQAVEDRQFKHHHGIAPTSIARAMLANMRAGRTVQGGSTLTQQLVKNYFLTSDRTIIRKVNEAIMAVLLERHYSKSEILEAYLNEIFLGQQGKHAIHGFGRASEFYFDKPLKDLQTQDIALLVGMVRGASYYNPRRNPDRALSRRNQVLDMFASTGILTEPQAIEAKAQPLGVTEKPRSGGSRYPAFVDLVRRQLKRDYHADDLRSEGLRIFTTLAPSEQEYAQNAVTQGLQDLAKRGLPADLQGAMVLVDVASGEVRALVGDRAEGRNYFNRALDARRQIGSVIKPLVYLLALEHSSDYNLLTPIVDEPISLRQADGSVWSPENYDHKSHGEMPLMDGLIHSYNQATVAVGMNIGVANLGRKLAQLGINSKIPAVPATLLGAVELTPIEVTQMYQSLAAGGYSVPLRSVTAVQTPQGKPLNRYPLRLMPLDRRDAIAILNYALTQVVERGTAKNLHALVGNTELIAGKTGTTNEQRDSWFVGYTRERVGVAWVGLDDNAPARVTGNNAAMRVWAGLFKNLPPSSVDLRMPDGAGFVWVDVAANALSAQGCGDAVQIPFIDGTAPEATTKCFERVENDNQSFWSKWFDRDD
jgi:penicillin-binding protein 1B